MKVGDRVVLSREGKEIRDGEWTKQTGRVTEIKDGWITVWWEMPGVQRCQACNGEGVIKRMEPHQHKADELAEIGVREDAA